MGSLFAVHAPTEEEEEAAEHSRNKNALSFRYREGHWSRDGLLWIVGDGEGSRFHVQKSLKAGQANTANNADVKSAAPAAAAPASATAAAASPAAAAVKPVVAANAKSAAVALAAPAATTAAKRAHAVHRAIMSNGQEASASSSSSQTLSTGPLSLKRLLKDFNSYESAFGAFFGDDKHDAHTRPRFAQAHLKDHSKLNASYERLKMQQAPAGSIINMENSVGE